MLDVVAEEGGPEVLYALIRKGRVVTTSKVDIPYMGYPQIEVIGDSLYIAYTGTIGRHAPELAEVRPRSKPDGNNVFFSSRHVDGEKWSSPQLVADTEESKAHYVKTTSYKNTLQIGYVEQHPDSLQDYYRQHTIKVGDAPQTLDIMRYELTGNVQRLNSFQTIPGAPGVMILQWKGQPTEFHLLRFADTKPQVFRTELPEMSGTYYMNGDTPQVSYIAIKRNRPPMELEIRMVRFDP